MTQQEMFDGAAWITREKTDFPVIRKVFSIPEGARIRKAVLRVIGLGFFRCRINGREITEHAFLPLSTDYEPRKDYPIHETLTGHRTYVPEFDVTEDLHEGKNLLALTFGGGWYVFWNDADGGHSNAWYDPGVKYGSPKAIYRLTVTTDEGETEFVSSPEDRTADACVYDYSFTTHECRDLRAEDPAMVSDPSYDDSGWDEAVPAKPLDTVYMFTDCPKDAVAERLPCVKNAAGIWDCGKNISGYPVLRVTAAAGDKVRVVFSEEILPEGDLDMKRNHGQRFELISDGAGRVVHPEFTWFGFRYFTVEGAEPVGAWFIHSDIAVSSSFECDNPVLNYLYKTYINTQLANMHAGIPSDCPHAERRGYTGDGELTADAAMTVLDARKFYKKWIEDISDCQDTVSGHVQYTAPYVKSGGGPGAWGCAIVEVPWQYYLHYGDPEPMFRLYPQMKRYFDYLEAHSEFGLVTSDKEGEWCLGDWCTPEPVFLPAAFVNNFYYIRSLREAAEIARMQGLEEDAKAFDKTRQYRMEVTRAAYLNPFEDNFIGSRQGANAFGLQAGIGNERCYSNMVRHYTRLGEFDTGICGTDLVLKTLFEHGDAQLAMSLMASEKQHSFGGLMALGATTLWEYWPNDEGIGRSFNHPMFGSPATYLFRYGAGIRQVPGTAGYRELVIEPAFTDVIGRLSAEQTIPAGKISVSYEKDDFEIRVKAVLPEGVKAKFVAKDFELCLKAGENSFLVPVNP